MRQTPLDAALRYAAKRWRVIPNHVPIDGGCSCQGGAACGKPGKHPRPKRWQQVATSDEATIREWWSRWPNANVGIVCGRETGLIAIDLDGDAGVEAFRKLVEGNGGDEGEPLRAITGSGTGRHLVYRYHPRCDALKNWVKRDGSPIDIRTNGGNLIVAPSLHRTGGRYEWLTSPDIEPGPMPQWLIDQLLRSGESKPAPQPAMPEEPRRSYAGDEDALFVKWSRRWLSKVPASIQGSNGSAAMLRACRHVYWAMDYPDDIARTLVDEYNARAVPPWEGKELEHKIAESQKSNGAGKPRGWKRDEWRERQEAKRRDREKNGWTGENRSTSSKPGDAPKPDAGFRPTVKNYGEKEIPVEGGEEGETKAIAFPRWFGEVMTDVFNVTGEWPKCAGAIEGAVGTLFAPHNGRLLHFEKSTQLYSFLENFVILEWRSGNNKIGNKYRTMEHFFEFFRVNSEQYKAVETFPHFPRLDGHYYHHPDVKPGDGSHLDKFLAFFNPATEHDRQLMRAFVMQLFWGGQYGSRPAWLIAGPDQDEHAGRGVGKTTFVQKCSDLVGGMLSIGDPGACKSDDIERRILSPQARPIRIIMIDNLKTHNFSWGFIESQITCSTISGRQLFVGEGRRPNSVTWVITANGATLSRDMAQRCNVLKLARPTYAAGDWDLAINDFIVRHRWQIVGDVAAAFGKPTARVDGVNRWGLFSQEILGRLDNPSDVQKLLASRVADVDGDSDESDLVRNAIMNVIRTRVCQPDPARLRVKFSPALASIFNFATGSRHATNIAVRHTHVLGIKELRKGTSRSGGRWHEWIGEHTTEASPWNRIVEVEPADLAERGE